MQTVKSWAAFADVIITCENAMFLVINIYNYTKSKIFIHFFSIIFLIINFLYLFFVKTYDNLLYHLSFLIKSNHFFLNYFILFFIQFIIQSIFHY